MPFGEENVGLKFGKEPSANKKIYVVISEDYNGFDVDVYNNKEEFLIAYKELGDEYRERIEFIIEGVEVSIVEKNKVIVKEYDLETKKSGCYGE